MRFLRRTKRLAAAGRPRRKLSLPRRLAYTAVVDLLVLAVLAVAGEVVLRVGWPQAGYTTLRDSDICRFSDDMYLGFELRPGVADHNSAGFRGHEVQLAKPAGAWRIAFLGDSVTYGLGVRADEAFPAIVEHRLNAAGLGPAKVLNCGVPGFSTFQEYTLLRTKVLAYDPDVVVLVFSSDDTETSPVIIKVDGRTCLFRNQLEGNALWNNRLHWSLVGRSHLYCFLYQRVALALTGSRGRFDAVSLQPDVAWQNVLRIAKLCKEQEQQFLLVLSPLLKPHYWPEDPSDPARSRSREMLLKPEEAEQVEAALDRIRELAREAGVELLDLGPLYEKHGAAMKRLPIDHEHPGVYGHRVVAEAVFEKLSAMRTATLAGRAPTADGSSGR